MSTSSTSRPSRRPSDEGRGALKGAAIVETSGEANVLAKGRLLYPERGPSRFAVRVAMGALASARDGPGRLFVVPSPCLWYGVEALAEGLPEGAAILCIETDPELAELARAHLPARLAAHPRIRFVDTSRPQAWVEAAESLGRFRRVVPVALSGGIEFDRETYRQAVAVLDDAFASWWKNRASLAAMGRLWIRNIFRNLSRMAEIAPRAPPSLDGPVVVCGAGPSLESALPFLTENRQLLRIVAVDTAAGTLLRTGLRPDLVVCLEAQVWNLRDFIGLDLREVRLLGDLSSHPDGFRLGVSANFLSAVAVSEGPFLGRLRTAGLPILALPPLGSVGVHAFRAALELGAGPVFLAGLDFAFETGKTHARGAPSQIAELSTSSRLCPLGNRALGLSFREGVRKLEGGRLTDPVLSLYAGLLAEEIALAPREVFDLRMGFGLPLGAAEISFERAEALLKTSPTHEGGISDIGDSGESPPATAGAARALMEGERTRLLGLEAKLRGREPATRKEVLDEIARLDYLLWPQPDADRLAEAPQDLLNRVLVETEYWLWRLAKPE